MNQYSVEQKAKILKKNEQLFASHPPLEIRDTLLEFYQLYTINEHNCLHINFKKMALGFYSLSEFLKYVDKIINNTDEEDEEVHP